MLMKKIRVAIFEDNRNLRESLFKLLETSDQFTCVGAFANCERVVENIEETQPDVILMDIEMPLVNGIEAVRMIREKYPDVKILMETIFEEDEKIFQSICNGAQGYILKSTPPEEILDSIKEIHHGGAPMSSQIARKVVAAFSNKPEMSKTDNELHDLSNREKQILEHLSKGMMYKEIAAELFISPETVRKHVYHIYEKLHVTNRVEAVNKYYGR